MVQKLVRNHTRYLLLRGRTYYFRFTLPANARKLCPSLPEEVKRSLRTDSLSDAVYLVSQKLPLIKLIGRCCQAELIESLYQQLLDFTHEVGRWVAKKIRVLADPQPAESVSDLGAEEPSNQLKLSEAWAQFVQWKSWTEKRAKDNQRLFDNLLFFLGDIPVEQIGKDDLRSALAGISQLPQRNKKQYKDQSLQKLSDSEVPEEDRVSGKYVKEHLKLAQSLFSRYLAHEVEILSTSPTDGLRWATEDNRYASLGDSQVRELLNKSKAKPEWFRWFLLLAAYSGARRSEIASLRPDDFKLCSDSQRYYFAVRKGKTKASRRLVPVHRELISLGFLAWVEAQRGRLFPIAFANPNRVTDLFGSLLDERTNDLGEKFVFHSIRHTFITKARAAGISSVLVQQVVGHEKTGAGITDRYTHRFELHDVLPVVDVVRF